MERPPCVGGLLLFVSALLVSTPSPQALVPSPCSYQLLPCWRNSGETGFS